MKNKMRKSDLKDRMVVEYRNEGRRIVIGDRFVGEESWSNIVEYNEDLTHLIYPSLDIIKVFREVDILTKIEAPTKLIWNRDCRKVEVVYAKHFGNENIYQWINNKNLSRNLRCEDLVVVSTRLGNQLVEVVEVRKEYKSEQEIAQYEEVVDLVTDRIFLG